MQGVGVKGLLKTSLLLRILLSRAVLAVSNVVISILIQLALTQSLRRNYLGLSLNIGLMLLSALGYVAVFYLTARLLEAAKRDMNLRLADQIARGYLYGGHMTTGQATNLLMQDSQNLIQYFQYALLPVVDFGLTVAFGLIYVGSQSLVMLVVFIAFGVCAAVASALLYQSQKRHQDAVMQVDDSHKTFFEQMVRMVPVIRNLQVLGYMLGQHESFFSRKQAHLRAYATTAGVLAGIFTGGVYLVEIVLLLVGYSLVHQGVLGVPAMLGALNAGVGSILWPMISLPSTLEYFVLQRSSAQRFTAAMTAGDAELATSTTAPLTGRLRIRVQNLSFTYPDKQEPALSQLNLTVPNKGMTYVTATNGKGKTTLFNLILGNLRPTTGQIEITNGADSDRASRYTAYVPQLNYVSADTLRRNLVFERPVADAEIQGVLRAVNLSDFASNLDQQLDMNSLSGGQKRRIGIARALLSDKPFILLDEPFSDIDRESQQQVVAALRQTAQQRGVVVITHTRDMITAADTVLGW